jgi:hypothetical protein
VLGTFLNLSRKYWNSTLKYAKTVPFRILLYWQLITIPPSIAWHYITNTRFKATQQQNVLLLSGDTPHPTGHAGGNCTRIMP